MGDWEHISSEDDPEDESKWFVTWRVTYNGEDALLKIYHFDKPNKYQDDYESLQIFSEPVIPGTTILKYREEWIEGTIRGRER